ncbi:hypothetical protein ACVQ8P_05415 [Dellaglioa sp. BT-FLS60]
MSYDDILFSYSALLIGNMLLIFVFIFALIKLYLSINKSVNKAREDAQKNIATYDRIQKRLEELKDK